jgi:hypothetical protein
VSAQHALPAQAHLSDGRARISEEPRSDSHNNPSKYIWPAEYKKGGSWLFSVVKVMI